MASATPDPTLPNDGAAGAAFTAVECFLPETDMEIVKTMADPVVAGETVRVTLTVTNNGLHAAQDVSVQDALAVARGRTTSPTRTRRSGAATAG